MAFRLQRLAMRAFPIIPAAFVVALGVTAAPHAALADSPVVIEGGDDDMRDAIRDLLPDRDRPESLFDAERIAEEAATRALVWLRSEGYYGAEVTPEASEEPALARVTIAPGPRFSFADPEIVYAGGEPDADARTAVMQALSGVQAGAPARAETVIAAEGAALAAWQEGG